MPEEITQQVGALELLKKIKNSLQIAGKAPDHVEKYIKIVYFANPANDPLNVENVPQFAKLRKSEESTAAVGAITLTFTVPTGYKALVKKIMAICSNGSTNFDLKQLIVDDYTLMDWFTNAPLTYRRIVPSNEIVLVGASLGASDRSSTVTNAAVVEQLWATRTVKINATAGADNFCIMQVHYELYPLNVDESALTDY